ncbi:MAG: class I SAM-dependent methyltransferase [Oscillospiraceae bacterium]|nr:class I SAM-dependent methyltransferase [Oscillospiraceae bacterium]
MKNKNKKNVQSKDMSFAKQADSYDEGFAGRASQKFYNLLLREAALPPGAAVLDVGCGTGALLRRFDEAFGIDGCGADIEEAMLAQARAQCPHMRFALAPCGALPFEDQSFDAVLACMAYHHFGDKEGFAREAARVLKPGGALLIADPNFPRAVRRAINGLAKAARVTGEFLSAPELEARFAAYGFQAIAAATDAYALVIKLGLAEKDKG